MSDRPPLGEVELASLEKRMRDWVAEDEPFRRQEVSLAEAMAYFESKGYHDKVRLLAHRQKDYVTLYQLDDYRDYHHGYMVPSTGYLKWFDLLPAGDGFILRFPQRRAPTSLSPMPEYPKLLAAFRQYGEWLERLGIDSVGALNDAIQGGRSREVILVSEALHEQNIADYRPPDRRARRAGAHGAHRRAILFRQDHLLTPAGRPTAGARSFAFRPRNG